MPQPPPIDLANMLDLLLDAVCAVDVDGRFVYASAGCERVFGYTPAELVGRNMTEFIYADDRERTLRAAAEIMAGEPRPHFENRYVHKDGHLVHVMWSARWSETARLRVAVARDVTQLRHAERVQSALYRISQAATGADNLPALYREVHRIIAELLPASGFTVALHDAATRQITFPYCSGPEVPAPPPEPLDGESVSARIIRTGEEALSPRPPATGAPGPTWLGVPLRTPDAVIGALVVHPGDAAMQYTPQDHDLLQFASTQLAGAIERQRTQAWLQHAARHDPLTDLPNRWLLRDRLGVALRWAHRHRERVALLYIDLDRFKAVNDCWGHGAGDALLRGIARRLLDCVREADTVSRVGGDEFTILLNDVGSREAALPVAQAIHAALARPFDLGAGRRLTIGASIGIAIYPDDGIDEDALVGCADTAMYAAKRHAAR